MASSRDVQDNMATLIDGVIYPNGHASPSITGNTVKISIGWPISHQLDTDLLSGNAQVSIFTYGKSGKNTTRFQRYWHEESRDDATLFADVINNTVTITGTISIPQAVVIILNGIAYGYAVLIGDTLDSIAANVAALLPSASAVGNVITVSGELLVLKARISVGGSVAQEIKRQIELFGVSIFSPNPDERDTLGDAIDIFLGNVERLNFSDTTQALISWKNREEFDKFEKNVSYGRILIYSVEYPTMIYDETMSAEAFEQNLTTTTT